MHHLKHCIRFQQKNTRHISEGELDQRLTSDLKPAVNHQH